MEKLGRHKARNHENMCLGLTMMTGLIYIGPSDTAEPWLT